ncbi:FAD dependent oxidoreductase-domain-containing protein [Roridomyces roridus]|uniref:FAD dependent oxidoreductase-domain-containing protein n=1 Tax=Roridomyces roridus TaxID=1738132 RepID=A0AAD7B9Z1_9AGAR|nr:FAD dependent oxidoreductase-domain-containing protein [Roridomyces roridus]
MDALPGYPRPHPCLSFWLMGARNSRLICHRTTATLPEHADVTIISSGLSLDYGHYKKDFGKELAMKIIQNEMDTLDLMTEIIKKEGIDCDFWRGFSYAVPADQPSAEALIEGVVERILDPEAARQATRCPKASAVYKSPASSLWPHKLVIHLLTLCIEKHGLNLQTHTTVRAVCANSDGSWNVQTDRGVVRKGKVVYATNAFTATLLPEFLGHISLKDNAPPLLRRGAKGAQAYEDNSGLRADYMIQREQDGLIIFGGRRGAVSLDKLLGNANDTEPYPELSAALKKTFPAFFQGWDEQVEGEGQLHVWSGIMGYTTEGVPYVGELYDKPGAFICAGHHGHEMVCIMTCAKGLTEMIMMRGGSWASTGLPECFQPTRERLAKPAGSCTMESSPESKGQSGIGVCSTESEYVNV